MKIEISTREVKKGMKVLAISSTKEVRGVVNDIGHITFGVYDGEQTWGFFFDEPCKARVYLIDNYKEKYCECEKCPNCGKIII